MSDKPLSAETAFAIATHTNEKTLPAAYHATMRIIWRAIREAAQEGNTKVYLPVRPRRYSKPLRYKIPTAIDQFSVSVHTALALRGFKVTSVGRDPKNRITEMHISWYLDDGMSTSAVAQALQQLDELL